MGRTKTQGASGRAGARWATRHTPPSRAAGVGAGAGPETATPYDALIKHGVVVLDTRHHYNEWRSAVLGALGGLGDKVFWPSACATGYVTMPHCELADVQAMLDAAMLRQVEYILAGAVADAERGGVSVGMACARAFDSPISVRPAAKHVTFDGKNAEEFPWYRMLPARPVPHNGTCNTMRLHGFANLGTRVVSVSIVPGSGHGFSLRKRGTSLDDTRTFTVAKRANRVETVRVAPGETILYDATSLMCIPLQRRTPHGPSQRQSVAAGIGALDSADLRKTFAFWLVVASKRNATTPDGVVRRWSRFLAAGLAPPCPTGLPSRHIPSKWHTLRADSTRAFLAQFGCTADNLTFSKQAVIEAHARHRWIYETEATMRESTNDSDSDSEYHDDSDNDSDSDEDYDE